MSTSMDDDARKARARLAAVAAGVVLVVAVTAGLLALVAGDHHASSTSSPSSASSTTRASTVDTTVEGTDDTDRTDVNLAAVYRMPTTDDPVEFGKAYATALLTFDTTHQSLAARRKALLAWTPSDGWFTDAQPMLVDFLGGEDTWNAATQVHQTQSVVIERAWVPSSVKEKMKADPAAFKRTHWPYIVTVSLVRELRGDVGANSDQPLTVSVLVSCPPSARCVALAPGRSVVED